MTPFPPSASVHDGTAWWALILMVYSCLVLLLAVSTTMFTRSVGTTRFGVSGGRMTPSSMEANAFEPTSVRGIGLFSVGMMFRHRAEFWHSISTKLFIFIVLSCACLYVATALPFVNPPFWWTACLHLFVYPSAYLFYRVIRLEE